MQVYSVSGGIKVDQDVVTEEVLNALEFDLNMDSVVDLVEDGNGKTLYIDIEEVMSTEDAENVSKTLELFAKQFSLRMSVLTSQYGDNEPGELFVGPGDFDKSQARIDHIDMQIKALKDKRDRLVQERILGESKADRLVMA